MNNELVHQQVPYERPPVKKIENVNTVVLTKSDFFDRLKQHPEMKKEVLENVVHNDFL